MPMFGHIPTDFEDDDDRPRQDTDTEDDVRVFEDNNKDLFGDYPHDDYTMYDDEESYTREYNSYIDDSARRKDKGAIWVVVLILILIFVIVILVLGALTINMPMGDHGYMLINIESHHVRSVFLSSTCVI